jgi:hypothetical protein
MRRVGTRLSRHTILPRVLVLACATVALAPEPPAAAQPGPAPAPAAAVQPAPAPVSSAGPVRSTTLTIGGSQNPPGLLARAQVQWRWRTTASSSPLLSDAHVAVGLTPSLSPSYTRLDAWVEVAPLSIFNVRAGIEPAYYFGTFGSLVDFSDYRQPFGWKAVQAREDEARAAAALRLYVNPTVQIRVGRVAAASSGTLERWRADVPGPLFYEVYRDTLIAASGGTVGFLSNVAVYEAPAGRGKLSAGVLHDLTYVYAFPDNRIQRIGPVVMYEAGWSWFVLHRPTFIVNVGYYLDGPSKKGQGYYLAAVTVPLGK